MYEPSPEERARTVLRVASSVSALTALARVDMIATHGADHTGAPLLVVPERSPLAQAARDISCVVHAIDIGPAPLPDRVRGEVWLGGWLAAVPAEERADAALALAERSPDGDLLDIGAGLTVLRLEVAEVRLADRLFGDGRVVDLDAERYADANADPLADGEAEWLGHLMAAHPAEFAQLCSLVPEHARPPGARLHPVALDRHGLLLRIDSPSGYRHVRLPFPAPVNCPRHLPGAMTRLLRVAAAPVRKGSE